jgi:putative transposase
MARTHPLAFPIRLPDALQAEALRLLDASRGAINQLLVDLWPTWIALPPSARDRPGSR